MALEDENSKELVPTVKGELVAVSGVDAMLSSVRPAWQAKGLIERVRRLLPVDPSSACQRILNAAIHDLREKILVAGIDIANETAARLKLPPVQQSEHVMDSYSVTHILDLAHGMGLLTRPEWKRIKRAYEIRRDLEHEDDEYEAQVEDCVYMFRSAIEIVLSRDPVQILKVSDVKALVQSPSRVTPTAQFIEDFKTAPDLRQKEIGDFLVSQALSEKNPDIVRENSVACLSVFNATIRNTVKIGLAASLESRLNRSPMDMQHARVAASGGFFPYLSGSLVKEFCLNYAKSLWAVGYGWQQNMKHGEILGELEEIGGLVICPSEPREDIVLWMTLCYIGEPGGYGWSGRHRLVFYSNTGAPLIRRLFTSAGEVIRDDLDKSRQEPRVRAALGYQPIARRFESLVDCVTGTSSTGI